MKLKRRKSINEDDPNSKCANEPFEFNNDCINNDSDVNEDDILHKNFSSLEPNMIMHENIDSHSVSSIIEQIDLLEAQMRNKEHNHDSLEHDDCDQQIKEFSEEEFDNFGNYGDPGMYENYPARSKFESQSTDESDPDENYHRFCGLMSDSLILFCRSSYERDSHSVSSGSSSSESFGSSISSSRNPKKNRKKSQSREKLTYKEKCEEKLIFSPVKEPETDEEIDCRPLYYPAIQV